MKFCREHWKELRDAIESKGMGHLIKKTPEEATELIKKDLAGTSDAIDFDPLLSAYWMLNGRALEMGGLYLMMTDENGNEFCPMCELNKNIPKDMILPELPSKTWIQGCTDSVLQYCKEQGLVPVMG